MTIRGRVTLWYSVLLFISFVLVGSGMYFELIYERNVHIQKHKQQEPLEEELGEILGFYVLPVMALSALGGWLLLRRSFAPLDQLTRAAERLNAENLRDALPRTFNGDEVDRLSEVLNAKNQRLSAVMNEIHEFTLHASHELKTPLAILHSEIETALARWQLSPEQRERLGSQLDEIQRLTRIVEALGLLARSNSGDVTFARDPLAFHEIVRDIAEDAVVLARPKEVSVTIEKLDEGWVLGDRNRLRQMLLNLAENASKYNKPGGVITIALRNDGPSLTLELANTGDGIPKEVLPNVFKKFYRGNSSSSADPGGAGLGLSIAQAIAKAHHGEINIESSPKGWTIARLSLPKITTLVNPNAVVRDGKPKTVKAFLF